MKTVSTKLLILLLVLLQAYAAKAQRQLSEAEAVSLYLARSPGIKAAALQTGQSRSLQKAAVNLPNPDIMAESPTGDFMAVGVLQSFSFPTVYGKQVQLARQQTELSKKAEAVSTAEAVWHVKSAYLGLQAAMAVLEQLRKQDSLLAQAVVVKIIVEFAI